MADLIYLDRDPTHYDEGRVRFSKRPKEGFSTMPHYVMPVSREVAGSLPEVGASVVIKGDPDAQEYTVVTPCRAKVADWVAVVQDPDHPNEMVEVSLNDLAPSNAVALVGLSTEEIAELRERFGDRVKDVG